MATTTLTLGTPSVSRSGGSVTISFSVSTTTWGAPRQRIYVRIGSSGSWSQWAYKRDPNGATISGTYTNTFTDYGAGSRTYYVRLQESATDSDSGFADVTTKTTSKDYTACRFTVTFNANGGSTPSAESKSVTYGQTYGTLASCSRTGYTFSGWFTASEGGTEVKSSDTVAITADTTLYAHWTAKSITATFKLQGGKIGGSAEDVTKTETYDSAWVLPADPTRDGYTFAGWYTAASGGTQITNATTVSVASNTTVYAQWTGNEVTCTYDARGGTVNPAGKTVTVGSAYGELPAPTRAGYRFLGWWATVLGNTEITPESTVTATASHTIYARWEAMSVLRYVGGGEAKTITNIKVVESGTVRNIVGCYSVESGVVKQGV